MGLFNYTYNQWRTRKANIAKREKTLPKIRQKISGFIIQNTVRQALAPHHCIRRGLIYRKDTKPTTPHSSTNRTIWPNAQQPTKWQAEKCLDTLANDGNHLRFSHPNQFHYKAEDRPRISWNTDKSDRWCAKHMIFFPGGLGLLIDSACVLEMIAHSVSEPHLASLTFWSSKAHQPIPKKGKASDRLRFLNTLCLTSAGKYIRVRAAGASDFLRFKG